MVAGGLRVTEEGVAYNHHFLKITDTGWFPEGEHEISVYARLVNRKDPKLLMRLKISLSEEEATRLHMGRGALFTWDPDTGRYYVSFETKRR
jgi:hypothetical protein